MKSGKLKFLIIVFSIVVFFSFISDNEDQKNKILLNILSQNLENYHFQPITINDDFSKKVYDLYIKNLDFNKKYLIQDDIVELEKFKFIIDDQLKSGSLEFFDKSEQLITKRIDEVKTFYSEILSKPFDFNQIDSIELDPQKVKFSKDIDELKQSWAKFVKFQTLSKLTDLLNTQETAKAKNDTSVKIKTYVELEIEARQKILQQQNEAFKRLSKIEKVDRKYVYLNTITSCFDPHTEYFPPKEKEDFDIQMSGRLEGIGATLQAQSDGYIKVVKIVEGSAAWRQGQLEVGDLILKVAQKDQEPIDVVDMRLDEAVRLIRGHKGTEVRLSVKKRDGRTIIISIIRDIVNIDETFAKSAIIKDKKNSVGYIYLPKFYADFNDSQGRNCALDVEKEIEKLKKDNVKGIVLDLRNNGGGSLQDVVRIAGLFIEKGPIVQVKSRLGSPTVLNDNDSRIQFKEPLIVMINEFSASASEIFAAAIQDYKRGIILGSKSSYGKGTVQRFVNIDDIIPPNLNSIKPLGSLKITIQKFYRINGHTTQLGGVNSDIVLPDQYAYFDIGEKEQDYPLQSDEIAPVSYPIWYDSYNLNRIKKKSESRVGKNATFNLIKEEALRLKAQKDQTKYPLSLEQYKLLKKKQDEEAKKYDNIMKNPTGLQFSLTTEDESKSMSDAAKSQRNTWFKDLEKDIYLSEAFSIIDDIK